MTLENLFGVVNENVNMVIYTGCENVPIAVYDGRESIPNFLNPFEVFDIMPAYENGKEYFKVFLTAEYRHDICYALLETCLRNNLEELENDGDLSCVIANLIETIDEVQELERG